MLWIAFLACTAVIVYAGPCLAKYGDICLHCNDVVAGAIAIFLNRHNKLLLAPRASDDRISL